MAPLFLRGLILWLAIGVSSASANWQDILKGAESLFRGDNPSSATNSTLSDVQIDAGLKQALSIGAERAVALLGKQGGFFNDQLVRIALPENLQILAKGLRAMGQGQYVDEFEQTVNRAAEQAVPETLSIVKNTVQNIQLEDVQRILQGKDSAATDFLRERAGAALHQAVKPLVSTATQQAGVTSAYKQLVGQTQGGLSSLGGFFNPQNLDLDEYVTQKTLDGLFVKLAAEEKAIRENPLARTTELLEQVFTH